MCNGHRGCSVTHKRFWDGHNYGEVLVYNLMTLHIVCHNLK